MSGMRLTLAVLAGAALVTLGVTAHAEDARDGVTLHPSLRVVGVYDDNVFSSQRNERSDWGIWVEPRLEAQGRRGRLRAELDLAGELRRYRSHDALDQEFWTLLGTAELDLGRGLMLKLSDQYAPRPVRLGRPTDDGVNRVQTNRAQAELRWRRPLRRQDAIEVGVHAARFATERFVTDVDTDGDGVFDQIRTDQGDWDELAADVEWQRSLGRRLLLYLRGEGRRRSFDELPEADFRELATYSGLRVQGTQRLTLDAGFGWGRLDFDSGRDQDRMLLRTHLRWTEARWSAGLHLGRQFTADLAGREYVETSARFDLERALGRRTRVGVALLASHFDSSVPGAESNQFFGSELRLERQIARRVHGRLAWRYWHNGGDDVLDDFQQNRVTLELVYRR